MQEIVNRLQKIMVEENLTAASFADSLGIGRPILSHVLGGRNNPSLQLMLKILENYPAYSADWLLLGKVEIEAIPLEPKALEINIQPQKIEKPQSEENLNEQKIVKTERLKEDPFNQILVLHPDKTFDVYNPR